MRTTALFSLKNQSEIYNSVSYVGKQDIYLSSLFYSRWCLWLLSALIWTELLHRPFSYSVFVYILEGQVHQKMESEVVFSNYCIALHLMYLPCEICKQKHYKKALLNWNHLCLFLLKISHMTYLESSPQPAFTWVKLTIETPEQVVEYVYCNSRRSGGFIVNFEHISHLFLVFLFLTLNM